MGQERKMPSNGRNGRHTPCGGEQIRVSKYGIREGYLIDRILKPTAEATAAVAGESAVEEGTDAVEQACAPIATAPRGATETEIGG